MTTIDCSDTGSAYGLVIECDGNGAKVEGFVSDGATRRALQMVGNDAKVEIRDFAGDGLPVLLGVTERLEFVDAPGHVEDLKRYRTRGYAMKGNRIRLVLDRPQPVVDSIPLKLTVLTWPASRWSAIPRRRRWIESARSSNFVFTLPAV